MIGPKTYIPPRFIHSASRYFAGWDCLRQEVNPAFTSGAIGGSLGAAHPIRLPFAYPLKRVFWANGNAVAGNIEAALYNAKGQQFWSSGAVVQAGTNTLQYASADMVLSPGTYYLALVGDNIAGTHFRRSAPTTLGWRVGGLLQKTSASPLSSTLAGWSISSTNVYWLCGLTMTASGF